MSDRAVKKPTPDELAEFCAKCADGKLAENIIRIHLGEQSGVADWFVVCTANSEPQLRAVTDFVEREARDKFHLRPLSRDGESMSGWMLTDFGSVVVHVMTAAARDRYNLEGLWGEKPSPEAIKTIAEH